MLKINDTVEVKPLEWFEEFCYTLNDNSYGIITSNVNRDIPKFKKGMIDYCEKTVTISDIIETYSGRYVYKIKEDNGKYDWANYMLNIFPYIDYKIISERFCNERCVFQKNGENCKTCSLFKCRKFKYKKENKESQKLSIGDKVIVKSLKWFIIFQYKRNFLITIPGKDSCRLFITIKDSEILNFSGKLVRIEKVLKESSTGNNIFYKISGSNSVWPASSFSLPDSIDYPQLVSEYCDKCILRGKDCSMCSLNIENYHAERGLIH